MSNFKEQYLQGKLSNIDAIDDFVHKWHQGAGKGKTLKQFLGLNDEDFEAFLHSQSELKQVLDSQKVKSVASYSGSIGKNYKKDK